MKKIIVLLIFILICKNICAQFSFDSAFVLLSSPSFDFKNPVFSIRSGGSTTFLTYEKWDSSKANIAVRTNLFNGLGTETMISSYNCQNINQSIAPYYFYSSPYSVIVWQSNLSGNWDIYYSYLTSTMWTTPVPVETTTENEITPIIYRGDFGVFLLVYCKNGVIKYRVYYNNIWSPEHSTSTLPFVCSNPKIVTGNLNYLVYQVKINDTISRIYKQSFTIDNSHNVNFSPPEEIYMPKSQDFLTCSSFGCFFSYDTLGGIHVLFVDPSNSYNKIVQTGDFSGRNFIAVGTNTYWASVPVTFNQFAWLRKTVDSSMIMTACKHYGNSNYTYKSYYLGDSGISSKLALSDINSYYFSHRKKLVWEKIVNGRSAFICTQFSEFGDAIRKIEGNIPTDFTLSQNYPNPFNAETRIKFEIPSEGKSQKAKVKIVIYDILGKEAAVLVNEQLMPGSYEVTFVGSNYASGVYFYQLCVGDYVDTRKMVLLK